MCLICFAFWPLSIANFHSDVLKYFQIIPAFFFQLIIQTAPKSVSAKWNKSWLMLQFQNVHENMMLAPHFKPIVIYIKETKSKLN